MSDNTHPLNRFDVVILDGSFILHLTKDILKTFGNVSKKILSMITRFEASRMDIIFDQYLSPSIKECEQTWREESNYSYTISGQD